MSTLLSSVPRPAWGAPDWVAAWLEASAQDVVGLVRIERIGIGQSNITSVVTDARGRTWVLREPPEGAFGTAHDMRREMRMFDALADSGLPVPRVIARGTFDDGRAFFAMTRLPGSVLESEDDASALAVAERASIGVDAATVLARLHTVDPVGAGLGDLVSATPYVSRQVRRITESWQAVGAASRHDALWAELRRALETSMPEQERTSVVHGDYRLSNLLIGDGAVTGVLDWELSAVGDPMVDLAWLLDDWRGPDDAATVMPSPTRVGGFGSRQEIVKRYAEESGVAVSKLDYYRSLTQWRAASLLQGVLVRRRSGVLGSQGELDLGQLDNTIGQMLEMAAELLRTNGDHT